LPLTEEQKERLKEKLDQRTGKNVSLNCTVDPQCLGGIRIDYNDQRIDGTVANRLAAVSELLKNTAF
jgi:F-type H+-transporting ATPase subunit delta